MEAVFEVSLHVLSWLALAALLIFVVRWARTISPRSARVIMLGAAIRLVVGFTLFLVSAYRLPVLESLQGNPGFWAVAPDAEGYFRSALLVAEQGFRAIPWERGSPTYIVILSAWMHLVGFSPVAGFLLNLVAYVAVCVLLVWRLRTDRLSLIPVAILTFSPVLLIHGSQPLKDELFLALIGVALIALSIVLPQLTTVADGRWTLRYLIASITLVAAVTLMAGIRTYYAFEVCVIVASALLLGFLIQRGSSGGWYAVQAAVLWGALYLGFQAGGGKYFYSEYRPHTLRFQALISLPAEAWSRLSEKRTDFVETGGGTSLVQERRDYELDGSLLAPPARPKEDPSAVTKILIGVAALFVPMTVLQSAGLFELGGGRGLIGIADLDTLYFDVTIILTVGLIVRHWPMLRKNWALT